MAEAKRLLAESRTGMALGYWMGGMPMVPWWRVMKGSGGQFVEQTTHIVDLLRCLCGEVTEVYAAYALQVMDRQVEGTDVPDVGTVTFKLASGAVATISNTCLLPVGHHVGLDVYTDRGVLEIRGNELRDIAKSETRTVRNVSNPYYVEDEAFVHALRTGDSSRILSDYADALRTHEVTIAANESALSGKPISISPAGGKGGAGE
jgi:predicted dehydrogenase